MFLKLPENNEKIFWTRHSKDKMRQYQLSDKRVLKVFRRPSRKEEGIAKGTIAVMQTTGTKKHPTEIWLMYQIVKVKIGNPARNATPIKNAVSTAGWHSVAGGQKFKKIKIISTWRYPGQTPVGKPIPIPQDILEELQKMF